MGATTAGCERVLQVPTQKILCCEENPIYHTHAVQGYSRSEKEVGNDLCYKGVMGKEK